LAICAWRERHRWQASRRFAVTSCALFTTTVLVVWPAAILKLSFLKAHAVTAYLAVFREPPWGNVGLLGTWQSRLLGSPLKWAIVLLSLILRLRKHRPKTCPLSLFVLLMAGATLRVLTSTLRYSLPWMPALDLFAGLTLAPILGLLGRPASFAVVALAVVSL
jgi:hypothetical protein